MPYEVLKDIFCIPVPLPHNPLKSVNSYLIRADGANLLIDTGFCLPECREALAQGFEALGVRREDTDVLLTHMHADHSGLANEFAGETAIFISAAKTPSGSTKTKKRPSRKSSWNSFGSRASRRNDGPAGIHEPGSEHGCPDLEAKLPDPRRRDVVDIGGYHLACIPTPGHSP
jgi:glyoxylase-like metal-dependent hydrolase (beta-lactamase superfamily II)